MNTELKLDIDFLIGIADLHSGSQYSPLPDGVKLKSGNTIQPNEFQRWLCKCWDMLWAYADRVTKGAKVAVAVVGDTTEGNHHGGRELSASYVDDQMTLASALLKKHLFGRQLLMVEGTECHDADIENAIGEKLHAIPYRRPKGTTVSGIYAWPQIDLNVRGCCGTLRHHFPATTRAYLEAGAFSTQLGTDRIERQRVRMPPIQFLVSAHRHRFGAYTDGDAQVVVLPPWQGLTRHGRKVVGAARTVAGMAILDFRNADKYDPPQLIYKRIAP